MISIEKKARYRPILTYPRFKNLELFAWIQRDPKNYNDSNLGYNGDLKHHYVALLRIEVSTVVPLRPAPKEKGEKGHINTPRSEKL